MSQPSLTTVGGDPNKAVELDQIRNTPRERLTRIYAEPAGLIEQGAPTATYPLGRFVEALTHAGRERRSDKVLTTSVAVA
ncbi:hypothetical protein [Micromonospora sp. CPCC 205558]|uniref:hypothetical protein n=1 Tax=Micromonospora sp. CPCC 205558 TaxID=3122403 RepID=UPI002FEF588E